MTTSIYFVRHGEAQNPKKLFYGRLPGFGLSKRGVKQVEQTAKYLKTQHIDFIYSSPLLRAKETAQIIQKELGISQIYFSGKLMEVASSRQGLPMEQLREFDYEIFKTGTNGVTGETINEVLNRMEKFIKEISQKHEGKHVIAVSHGDPIMLVRAKITGLPITNASLRPKDTHHATYIQQAEVDLVETDGKTMQLAHVFAPEV
ncbi:MAG TPA: histidine phosphatase family protein [Candidatus Saccharimonadales bacterium]|nr:histidine phosphatase family protein [Candidatus Saccharimonadales bacterium]